MISLEDRSRMAREVGLDSVVFVFTLVGIEYFKIEIQISKESRAR